jgi:hypothetical protein
MAAPQPLERLIVKALPTKAAAVYTPLQYRLKPSLIKTGGINLKR